MRIVVFVGELGVTWYLGTQVWVSAGRFEQGQAGRLGQSRQVRERGRQNLRV